MIKMQHYNEYIGFRGEVCHLRQRIKLISFIYRFQTITKTLPLDFALQENFSFRSTRCQSIIANGKILRYLTMKKINIQILIPLHYLNGVMKLEFKEWTNLKRKRKKP